MHKVSIIMPTFNGRRYIGESIQSALSQTYPDIELIIVDDGSTDETYFPWLQAQACERVRVIAGNHGGPASARNIGIAQAEGEYILPLDDDDLIDPTYVEKAVAILDQNKSMGVVYCQADRFGAVKRSWDLPEFSIPQMLVDNVVFVSAVFRKSLWQAVGGFDEEMKNGLEDYDFWLSLIEKGAEFYRIPQVLFHCRVKKKSHNLNSSDTEEKSRRNYKYLMENHKELYQQHGDSFAKKLREDWVHQRFIINYPQKKSLIKRVLRRLKVLKVK